MPRNKDRYPDHVLPSRERRAEWKQIAAINDDPDYDRRWLAFWKQTLDQLRDQRTWEDCDVPLLDEFVKWVRQAEDHRAAAESDAYQTHTESRRVFAHPGFGLERAARQEARAVARLLAIDPEARWEAGAGGEPAGGEDDAPESDQAGL